MRKIVLLLIALFAFMAPVSAQDNEVYTGVLFTRANPNFREPNFRFDKATDQLGFEAAYTRYFGDSPFGITGDLGASWSWNGDDTSLVTVMAGPTVKARGHRVQPFARGLIGVGRFAARNQQFSLDFRQDDSGLAMAAGGGVDIQVTDHFSIRPFQADFLSTRIMDKNVRYLRASAGLVFNW